MTSKKLLKEIGVELSEARAAYRDKKWNIVKACLLRIKHLIETKIKTSSELSYGFEGCYQTGTRLIE